MAYPCEHARSSRYSIPNLKPPAVTVDIPFHVAWLVNHSTCKQLEDELPPPSLLDHAQQ